ncbi:MAG: cupin domain-containing protein [Pseudomonadota bacterium]
MSNPRIINIAELPWRRCSRSERITIEFKDPARHLGSTVSGFRIERLAPGKQASPLHRHHLQEELFLILGGVGVLRHGDREVPVGPGDFIVYPPGERAPHTFVNNGSEPLEFIATGNRVSYEVCEYPEDGTVYVEVLDRTLRNEDIPGTRETIED